MTEYQDPLFLWLFLPLGLLILRDMLRTPGVAVRWSNLRGLSAPKSLRVILAPLPVLLQWAGMCGLILSLARPVEKNVEEVVLSEGIDIVLALDVSGSMEAPDFRINQRNVDRLHVAKQVVSDFVDGRTHDRIGLVVFGEEAFSQVPLTLDHEALQRFLDQVSIGMAGAASTAIGEALAVSARQLADLDRPSRVLILLTDGRNNAGSLTPLQAAQAAEALGVTIYTIGVGSTEGRRRGLFSRPTEEIDESTLTEIAQATGGKYFRAKDTRSLQEVYETIDSLEKTTADVRQYVRQKERYRDYLNPSVVLLCLSLLLSHSYLRRLP